MNIAAAHASWQGHARNRAEWGAVRLLAVLESSSGEPAATIRPPSSPAPGPMSITQSLPATTRMSCSTTMTVLPASTSPSSCAMQLLDVGRMQAGRGLVEDVERVAALHPLQFGRQLDPLRLAAGKLGRRLAQPQIAQADFAATRRANGATCGSSAKKSQAASTVMPSTSAIDLSRYLISSVLAL